MALIWYILHFLHFTVILLIIILIVECSISSFYVLLYPVNLIEILFSLILDKTRLYASEFTLHRVSLNDGPKTIATSIYPIRSSMESARLQQFIVLVRVFLCNPSIRELISEIIDILALRSLSIVDPALIVSSLWIEINDLIRAIFGVWLFQIDNLRVLLKEKLLFCALSRIKCLDFLL